MLNNLVIHELKALNQADIEQIIAWAGVLPADVKTAIIAQCGGHPFIAQYLLYHLWDNDLKTATPNSVKQIAKQFMVAQYADLERWAIGIGEVGQTVYKTLAQSTKPLNEDEIKQATGYSSLKEVRKLQYHSIVLKTTDEDTKFYYHYTGELFKTWFENNYLSNKGDDLDTDDLDTSVPNSMLSPSITFKVQLTQHPSNKVEVRGITVPSGGQPHPKTDRPFSEQDLKAIFKALNLDNLELPAKFNSKHRETLINLGLMHGERLRVDFREKIGRRLYNTLITDDLKVEFANVQATAKQQKNSIACELCFDPTETLLTQYPWELLCHKKQFLVANQQLELTRYITFADSPSTLDVDLPLKILFISPRPTDQDKLPNLLEKKAALSGLETLQKNNYLIWEELNPPTWEALQTYLAQEAVHVIHFDGHGAYARCCPLCKTAYTPTTKTCTHCKDKPNMEDEAPKGYLYFEKTAHNKTSDMVSITDMQVVLANQHTQLVVITACDSGMVGGENVFNGLAPGLIEIGIPAIVGMQGKPEVKITAKFISTFYEALAKGERIPKAVNRGRLAIFRDEPTCWFIPVVYLRTADKTHGQLFKL